MCKNTDESVNPMPSKNDKIGASVIKACICLTAIGDIITSSMSLNLQRQEEENERSIAIKDGINLILTLVDFGLSCGVGYGIYSPMDSSNERIKNSDYEKTITDTSDAAAKYSTIWIVKTAISLFIPSISVIKTISAEEEAAEEDNNFLKNVNMVNSACSGILCLVSAFFEIIACIEAGKVDNSKLTDMQKKDKSCFLCETIGFICSDACSVIDSIISIGNIKNIPIIVIREIFASAYAVSMLAESISIGTA